MIAAKTKAATFTWGVGGTPTRVTSKTPNFDVRLGEHVKD